MPDRIEAGTLLVATAITRGNVVLKKANTSHIKPLIEKLEESGCKIQFREDEIELIAPKRIKAVDIKTMPYPGFPTDLQSIIATYLTTANRNICNY